MFEIVLPDPADLDGLDEVALIAAMQECARVSAAADARKYAAIAEFIRRRTAGHGPTPQPTEKQPRR